MAWTNGYGWSKRIFRNGYDNLYTCAKPPFDKQFRSGDVTAIVGRQNYYGLAGALGGGPSGRLEPDAGAAPDYDDGLPG